jgi:hypothetical protein
MCPAGKRMRLKEDGRKDKPVEQKDKGSEKERKRKRLIKLLISSLF